MAGTTRAATKRRSKELTNGAAGQEEASAARRMLYGTRQNLLSARGPRVAQILLRKRDIMILVRRVELASLARSGRWPEPITSRVLRIMSDGNLADPNSRDPQDLYEANEAAAALLRACAIVPPEEFLDGTIQLQDIDPTTCEPLFVEPGQDPGPNQLSLLVIEDDSDSGEAWGEGVIALHDDDLVAAATQIYRTGPGSLATFRDLPARVVASMAKVAADASAPVGPGGGQ